MVRNIINDIAEAVRAQYQVITPVDISEAVKKMGGTISDDPSMDSFADGKIRKTGEHGFEIVVSSFQSPKRRKFTIAHELGHLFLHMGYMTNPILWSKQDAKIFWRNGNSDTECQANEFAAAFLMPQDEYREVMDRNTKGTTVYTSEIAKHFDVSVDTAANRGEQLGYLEW